MAEQRASTMDDLPKRSSLIRDVGVFVANMVAGAVTFEALSSMEICSRSFGSRTRKTSVSTMVLGSTLKEYCTVENNDDAANSRRMRTHVATTGASVNFALAPVFKKSEVCSRLDIPRPTSKSFPKTADLGTFASAAAISFWSSGEGAHTFNTLTLTCGCEGAWAAANRASPTETCHNVHHKMFRGTAAF